MGGFKYIKVEIFIGKNRAANRSDADDLAADFQIIDAFSNYTVNQTVAAARTVTER